MVLPRRLIATVAALVLAAGALLGGQEAPTFRSSVEAVQLSVIVTDAAGNPVTDLTDSDFVIIENRGQRPITTFAAIDIPIERTDTRLGERDVLRNDGPPGRAYVIVLDQMTAENAQRTRGFLRHFVEEYFGPNDTAAVVRTTRGYVTSGHEFTGNTRLLLNAIDTFDGGDVMGGWEREKNFTGDLRDITRVVATTQAARKAVIFVSQNIPVDPYRLIGYRPPRLGTFFSDVNRDFQDAMSYATRNGIAFYPVDPSGLTAFNDPDPAFGWQRVGGMIGTAAGSFGVSYGSSGAGRPTPFGTPFTPSVGGGFDLRGLAELTGGFALTNSNDFDGFLERVVRENSTYYVLGFNSNEERRDGRYVSVEVRVRRPGLQVRSLSGYVAPQGKPAERRVPKSVLPATWDAVASPMTTSGVPMRMFAAPFKSDSKQATVTVALEIAADKLRLVEEDGLFKGQMEILFAITDATNKKHPIYRHRAEMALKPETYDRVSRTALRVVAQLPLPKGRYQVRASAGGSVEAGSVVYDLVVPDFKNELSMSGVALSSAQSGETFTVSPHPIDVAFPGAPTTAREFARDDTLTVFTEAYENRKQPHTVTLTVELRNEAGVVVDTYTGEQGSETKSSRSSVYAFSPQLDLAQVPPGRYALHVDVRSSLDTRKRLTHDIPITVR